ncbi:hypothetical protein PSPO01_16205 [Paraphaeosphaeria sporulosa]
MFATDTSQSRFSSTVTRNKAKIGAVSRAGKARRPFDVGPKHHALRWNAVPRLLVLMLSASEFLFRGEYATLGVTMRLPYANAVSNAD